MLSQDLARYVDLQRSLGFKFRIQHILLKSFVACQRAAESPHFGACNFPHLAGWRSAVFLIGASVFRRSTTTLDRGGRG